MPDSPELTDAETIQRRSAFQAMQEPRRPAHWGVDLDPARRPGVPMMRTDPQPWPNTIYPPERQSGEPASPRHGRSNKPMPPVFGTALPMRGAAGWIRRFSGRYPDHFPRYWLLKLLADRVESWGHRARTLLPIALPVAVVGLALSRRQRRRRRGFLLRAFDWS
jgi:hypothetical protein